jgi:hypothetical protein
MTETITLGGREFTLRPLKLGQLRHVLDALDAMAGKSGGALIAAAAQVVAAGLKPMHPDLTADTILDLEAGIAELNTAVGAVLRIGGLQPPGEPRSPDGPSATAAPGIASLDLRSSSPPSTAPSPPAAATPTAVSTS